MPKQYKNPYVYEYNFGFHDCDATITLLLNAG